jgi:acetyltransferase-like isoleucine patch superfamily enzyme
MANGFPGQGSSGVGPASAAASLESKGRMPDWMGPGLVERGRKFVRELVLGRPAVRTAKLVDQGVLSIAHHTYGAPILQLHEGDRCRVSIGSYCSIAPGVTFMPGGNHCIDCVTTYPMRAKFGLPGAFRDGSPWSRGDTVVGSDVWIGRDALILGGVSIGNGAVVGARSVVARNVEPYSIVVGNPARHVRYRFSSDVVEGLLQIAWWDWSEEDVVGRIDELMSSDLAGFISKYLPAASRRQ